MNQTIEPLRFESLKAACIRRLEELILSGSFQIGERLPAERDLAVSLNVSRPVLHEALVDLAAKGLVTIQPRRGVYISDFRTSGSPAILASLLEYNNGQLDPAFTQSLIDMRLILEVESARLAALNRGPDHLAAFRGILAREQTRPRPSLSDLIELDFDFHLQVALASGNLVYPLIVNSFKGVYTNLTGGFFSLHYHSPVLDQVFHYHHHLVEAIQEQDSQGAAAIMTDMLRHGEKYLKGAV